MCENSGKTLKKSLGMCEFDTFQNMNILMNPNLSKALLSAFKICFSCFKKKLWHSKLSERRGWVMDLITDFTETAGGASAVHWSHRQCCWSVRKTSAVGRCYHMLQKTWQNGKGEGFRLKIWKFKLASLNTCCP